MTADDPDRAERLIADAERIARPIPGASARAPALAAVATALAAFDADRAARLVGDAERSAQSIPGTDRKASALAAVAAALAAVDPAHAERLARSISAAPWRATALAAVAAKSFMLPPSQDVDPPGPPDTRRLLGLPRPKAEGRACARRSAVTFFRCQVSDR